MKTVECLEKARALWLVSIPLFVLLPISITFLMIQNRFFEVETLIFGVLALICSVLTGIRFWDVYYRLSWRKKNVDPFGLYDESVGQAKESPWEKGIDWAIPIIGGMLIGFSFLPKCWFIAAFVLYLAACLRHTIALKREDWRKEIPGVKIGQINRFLKEKRRSTMVYMALFFIGIIAAWEPYNIINSILTWVAENPKYTVVIWVGLILGFRYIFRFTQKHYEREKIRVILSESVESIIEAIRRRK